MTDPHRKKRQLAQKLFEYPIPKEMKVKDMKREVLAVINRLFPLYRGQYTVAEAVKVLQKEQKELEALEQALETDKGGDGQRDIESNLKNLTVDESQTETQSVSEVEAMEKPDGDSEQREVFQSPVI